MKTASAVPLPLLQVPLSLTLAPWKSGSRCRWGDVLHANAHAVAHLRRAKHRAKASSAVLRAFLLCVPCRLSTACSKAKHGQGSVVLFFPLHTPFSRNAYTGIGGGSGPWASSAKNRTGDVLCFGTGVRGFCFLARSVWVGFCFFLYFQRTFN